jgi:DNA polymerase elongation subunit (family B)
MSEIKQFFSYSWHLDETEKTRTIIRVYGLTEDNENVCVKINDFTPYIYLELPEHIDWDLGKAQILGNKIDQLLGENMQPLVKQLMFKHRLYYANLDKHGQRKLFPYLMCSFAHQEEIKKASYRLRHPKQFPMLGTFSVKMHEQNAGPILQLTSLRKIPPTGWIKFEGKPVPDRSRETSCQFEYTTSWKSLFPAEGTTAKPLLMSFDIEVNSSVPTAMPKSSRPEDKVFQISCVFGRQGDKEEKYEKYLLTLGKPDLDKLDPDINVILADIEADLLLHFVNLMNLKNPNIVIGYNIFGFDVPYMIDRARVLGIYNEFDKQGMFLDGHAIEKKVEWSSSAYKNQSFQFLDAEGRIFVDLLPLVKRDYKMSSYSLKNIAAYFLKGNTKDPLDAKAIFKCYRLGMVGDQRGQKALAICGNYCVKDSYLTIRLFEVLTTWFALCEMSKVTNVPIFYLYTQGQQLKVFSQVYRDCIYNNIVIEKDAYVTKDDDRYMGATVFPPKLGVHTNVVPFDFASLYPSAIIAYNISWDTLVKDDPKDTSISDDKCHVMEWSEHIGCEHDPDMIRKLELNKTLDGELKEVKELRLERDSRPKSERTVYKSIIDAKLKALKPFREERAELQKNKNKAKICCKRYFRWLKEPIGVLPALVKNLLDTRAATKKELKGVKASIYELEKKGQEDNRLTIYSDVLDQRQNALKISANSSYGITGCRVGRLPFMPAAMCITYKGRQAIERAAKSIQEDFGASLVYGDSVSADTPVIIRLSNGKDSVREIGMLGKIWTTYNEFKRDEPGRFDKEQSFIDAQIWTNGKWSQIKRVIRHRTQKKMYRVLTHIGCVDVTEDHSLLRSNGKKVKPADVKIGEPLLHSFPTKLQIIDHIFQRMDTLFHTNGISVCYTSKNKLYAQLAYIYAKSVLQFNVRIHVIDNIYIVTGMKDIEALDLSPTNINAIKDIIQLPNCTLDKYVYDIETEEGVFQAGIGEMVLKNTDSNYVSFPHLTTIPETWDYAVKVADEVSKLFRAPMKLAFEDKIYVKFFIIRKKRYMSLICKNREGKIEDKIGSKGVLLQRRDNCNIIRKIYTDTIMAVFHGEDINKIIDNLIDEINKVCGHFYPITEFVITKSVGDIGALEDVTELNPVPSLGKDKNNKDCYKFGDYKINPLPSDPNTSAHELERKECKNNREYYLSSLPAQVQLAEKMRDRGQLIAPGSRLEYVITTVGGHTAKQSIKIESYEYFSRNSNVLKLDYLYYLKQLVNPLDQILDIVFHEGKKGFTMTQYKLHLQKKKTLTELKRLFLPRLVFE